MGEIVSLVAGGSDAPVARRVRRFENYDLAEPELRLCSTCGQPFETRFSQQRNCWGCVFQMRRESADLVGPVLERLTWPAFARSLQPRAAGAIEAFLESWPNAGNLVFLGAVGSGKTHAACAVLHELIRTDGVYGRYVHLPSLASELRRAEDWTETARELLSGLDQTDLLILDDVGREKSTDTLREALDAIIDVRWRFGRSTILTANFGRDDLTSWLGEAAASRLLSAGQVVTFRKYDGRFQGSEIEAALAREVGEREGICA